MGEARRRKLLGAANTHDMQKLRETDRWCAILASNQTTLIPAPGPGRAKLRTELHEIRMARRRRLKAKARAGAAK